MTIWATEYRPTLSEIVGQNEVINEITSLQHFIFYSPQAGTGKTSLALAMAKDLGWPIHVFNASSKKTRGIDFVEEELLPMSRTGNTNQFFLLDEADQLTPAAQSALKGVIENSQGYFILTCNDLSKVSKWLQSRCRVLRFNPISKEHIVKRLSMIAGKTGTVITEGQLNLIADAHEGDLRNSINALQAFSVHPEPEGFINGLVSQGLDAKHFLTLCFRENDYNLALKETYGIPPREVVKTVFDYAITSTAKVDSIMRIVDAAAITERDLIHGVEENIAIANFVRLCMEGYTKTLYP